MKSCDFCHGSNSVGESFGPWGTMTMWTNSNGENYVDVCDETQEAGEVTFLIHYCPMCGRKL